MANALICGSSRAIGSAIIRKLKDEGWNTISIPRDVSLDFQIADHVFETRFESPAEAEQTVYLVSREVDSIDLFCYAAGDNAYQQVVTMTAQDWQWIMDANLIRKFSLL
ncbi:MAG: SDR family NAD(P)-dependent oxidoreductase [Anaerolineales bacterium]